jgi:ATP-binding cassette subfamily F protein 3
MVDPGNLLLMDEPTNHLDLESSEALAEALETYDGTLVFVSHNRSFVRHLATRIWYVHDHVVEEFPGTMDEFLYHLAQQRSRMEKAEKSGRADAKAERQAEAAAAKVSAKASAKPDAGGSAAKAEAPRAPVAPQSKEDRARDRAKERELQNKRRALEKKVQDYEKRIAELETLQTGRSSDLSQPEVYADQSKYGALLSAYTEDQKKLEELMLRWEQAQAELAAAE